MNKTEGSKSLKLFFVIWFWICVLQSRILSNFQHFFLLSIIHRFSWDEAMKTPGWVGRPSRLVAHALPTRLRAVCGSCAHGSSCSQRPEFSKEVSFFEHGFLYKILRSFKRFLQFLDPFWFYQFEFLAGFSIVGVISVILDGHKVLGKTAAMAATFRLLAGPSITTQMVARTPWSETRLVYGPLFFGSSCGAVSDVPTQRM